MKKIANNNYINAEFKTEEIYDKSKRVKTKKNKEYKYPQFMLDLTKALHLEKPENYKSIGDIANNFSKMIKDKKQTISNLQEIELESPLFNLKYNKKIRF